MKIIELCRLTEDGEDLRDDDYNGPDPHDWWGVIETEEEKIMFEEAWLDNDELLIPLWNKMVNNAGRDMGLHWGDDDVYGYIMPSEKCPEVGEEYTDNGGDKWVRTE